MSKRINEPDELLDKFYAYLDTLRTDPNELYSIPTMYGFTEYAGYKDPTSWHDLTSNPVYSQVTKKIRSGIEQEYIKMMLLQRTLSGKRANTTGCIFYLKNKHGWIDKVEHNNVGSITLQVEHVIPNSMLPSPVKQVTKGKPIPVERIEIDDTETTPTTHTNDGIDTDSASTATIE